MKIEGPQRSQQSGPLKKKDKVAGGDGSFGDLLTEGTDTARGTAAAHSIATIDTLLAAQGAEDPAERAAHRRMRERAGKLLQELDNIRVALLTGRLTVGHVIDIADVVAAHRERVMDPQLTAILDEVDLRAQIEIAKMRKALDIRA